MTEDMKKFTLLEALGYLALLAMSFIWTTSAWHIFLTGGFYLTARYTKVVTHTDGLGAIFVAYIFLSLAPIALAIVLKRLGAPRYSSIATAVVMLGSPIIYFIAR